MRFILGVASAIVGWALWKMVGGTAGLIVGAGALIMVHLAASLVWQKLRKPGGPPRAYQMPYLAGWLITAALLLGLGAVVLVMGAQIDAQHAWVAQYSVNDALAEDYPGKGIFDVGAFIATAGLATLAAGIVRWLEHRRFERDGAKVADPS